MADQAQNLRDLVRRKQQSARVLAVTSGKGGVGKTNTSVNLAIALAAKNNRVMLIDADLGLANVEVIMGLGSMYNLEHVVDGEKSMLDILIKAPGGIEVVPGSSGLASVADLTGGQRERVLNELHGLQELADFLIIDTMAGIGKNALAFASAADEVILVTTPEPSAIVDAYAMLKNIHAMKSEAAIRVLVNMAGSEQQAQAVMRKLANVAQQYLSRQITYLGYLPRDQQVSQAVMQGKPFCLSFPNAPATKQIEAVAARIIKEVPAEMDAKRSFFRRFAQTLGMAG